MEKTAPLLTKSIFDKLIDATIEQSRYICCFTCITKDFEKEKENLKAKKSTIEEKVKSANRSDEGILPKVTFWQEQAGKLIQEETKTRTRCFFGWCPNCKRIHRRGKELANKTQEIKTLILEEREFQSVGIPHDLPDVEYYSSQHYISFKSRELKYKELLEALIDDNYYMVGLQGMGGTGKTTLAKEVGKELKKSKKFDQVIDTTISSTPDIKKIQDEMTGPLGLSLKELTESERPRKLRNRLTNGEKILIILDDVWGDISFEGIGIPLKDNHNGCKILVTTRDLRICHKMGCDKIIQLELLPEKEAWMLFKNHAGLTDSSPKIILDISRKITKECKGLPIAIAVIASSLKGEKRKEEWNVALKSLQNFRSQHGDNGTLGEIYKCLKYSYDNMKNETAKKLFLLCSVFQEDEEILDEVLTRISIGAGLVGEIDDNYDACRNEVLVAKNKLIDSCLLLKNGEGSVKMHDLVREVALLIANEEIKAVNTSNKDQKLLVERVKNLKYLLCEGKSKDVVSFKCDGSKLEILILYLDCDENDSLEIPNSFFGNMVKLRVLYLSQEVQWDSNISLSLPQSLHSLTNIRYLYLNGFALGDMSILGNFRLLETLGLDSCLIDELPCEIVKLEKLKLLNLCHCTFTRNNPFKVIQSCSSLEELDFISNFLKDSSPMHQKVTLPQLQRFCIILHQDFDKDEPYQPGRNCLSISNAEDFFSEDTLKHLLQKTEYLYLHEVHRRWRNITPDMILLEDDDGTLNLVSVCLFGISQLECLIDTKQIDSRVQNVFSKLVQLELTDMEKLKELCSVQLCNLKELTLISCPILTSLFQLSTAQSLVLLESLTIMDCEQLKSIIEDLREEIVDGDNDYKTGGSMFPNLNSLVISRCPLLDFVLPMDVARRIPELEYITIDDCIELKYIFGPFQHRPAEKDLHKELKEVMFVTLGKMVLEGLPNFVDIFPEEYGKPMCSSVKRSCSKEETKTQKELDPIKCNIFPWNCKKRTTKNPLDTKDQLQLQDCSRSQVVDSEVNDVIGQKLVVTLKNIQSSDMSHMTMLLQNVSALIIEKCEKMKVLFSASMLECLPQLHTLSIFGCNEVKYIIDGDTKNEGISFFPKLKVLEVRECNSLKCVFPISTSKMLPKLEVLVIIKASMLEEVFGESDKKVEIPNLKLAVLFELPNLCQEGIEFHTVEDYFVKYCPKLSLTSTYTTLERIQQKYYESVEGLPDRFLHTLDYLIEDPKVQETSDDIESDETSDDIQSDETSDDIEESRVQEINNDQNPTAKATGDFPIGTKVEEEALRNEFTSVETQTKETSKADQEFVEKEGTTSAFAKTTTLPIGSESGKGEGQTNESSITVVNTKLTTTEDVDVVDIQETSKSTITQFEPNVPDELTSLEIQTKETSKAEQEIVEKYLELIRGPSQCPLDIPLHETHLHEIKGSFEEGTTSAFAKTIASMIGSESGNSKEGQMTEHSITVVNTKLATTEDVDVGDIQETSKSTVTQFEHNAPDELTMETQTKETSKAEQVFVEKDLELIRRPSQCPSDFPLHETHSHGIKRSFDVGTTSAFAKTVALPSGSESGNGEGQTNEPSITVVNTKLATTEDVDVVDIQETSRSMVPQFEPNISGIARDRLLSTLKDPIEDSKVQEFNNDQNPTAKATGDFPIGTKVEEEALRNEFTSVEIQTKETSKADQEFVEKDSELIRGSSHCPLDIPLHETHSHGIKRSFDVGTTSSAFAKTVALPIDSESGNREGQTNEPSITVVNTKIAITEDVGVGDIQETSQSTVIQFETNAPEKLSQITEDSGFASSIRRELEKLVSNNHLGLENLTLLTNFLVKHPSVHLKDNASVSDRYKGFAYTCLAELLKFLKTHSVLDALGPSHSEFVKLLEDVRRFGFNRDWLNDVERRALFRGSQMSEDALQILLDSKNALIQQMDDLKHQLEEQEARVLQVKANLSTPIGY